MGSSGALLEGEEQPELSHSPPALGVPCGAGPGARQRVVQTIETTKSRTMRRGAFLFALALLAAALAVALPDGAQADMTRAAGIDVVGSGPLVWERVVVRARPTPDSRRVAVLHQFRGNYRPQYVLALAQRLDKEGVPSWYRVSVPGRPNGRKGWVRAEAVDIEPTKKRLVIYRGSRRFQFWNGNRLVRSGDVAVGKAGAETPLGLFYVTWKFNPKIDPEWAILGAYAFETSAYSRLTDWPGGGIVGVHGTPWPELLGQAVSHGCVRLSNDNIKFLRTKVPLGTPVKIVR